MKHRSISLAGISLAPILDCKHPFAQSASITIDGAESGPMYYGVGAISGGGANSTSGAGATIEPTRGAVNCNCGYEFWLMGEARARNPDIKFIALSMVSIHYPCFGNDR